MPESYILSSQAGAVRTLTINRPSTRNRLDEAVGEQLLQALDVAAADSAVRCLVLTGGACVFNIGHDLSNLSESPQGTSRTSFVDDLRYAVGRSHNPLVERLHSMPVPLIAAVRGRLAGAGLSLALHCDLVIAAKSATFVWPFGRDGLLPDAGCTWLLPRLVGRARALGWTLLGGPLKAEDAVRMGLIWDSVPDRNLDSAVRSVAQRLAAIPTNAAVAARKAMDAALILTLKDALFAEASIQRELMCGHDYCENVTAFLANRPAIYTDR